MKSDNTNKNNNSTVISYTETKIKQKVIETYLLVQLNSREL